MGVVEQKALGLKTLGPYQLSEAARLLILLEFHSQGWSSGVVHGMRLAIS
jgi:hypothetical protein